MSTNVSDFVNVGQKVSNLGCRYPEGLAFLPLNFSSATSIDDFMQASEAATVRKLFASEGLSVDEIVERDHRGPYLKNKSAEWVAPVLFIPMAIYSQNPEVVSLALNILGNYLTDLFRGHNRLPIVSVDIVIEKKQKEIYKRVSYEGPVEGMKDLPRIVREVMNE